MINALGFQRCKIAIILLSFALMSGCSAKHARVQDVSITTEPTGMRATIGGQACMTPCTLINVDRTAEYVLFEQGNFRQWYVLDKKYDGRALTTVKLIGLKMPMPAIVITGAAWEIQPIDIKFTGSAENSLQISSDNGTNVLHELAVEPDLKREQVPSLETMERPFASTVGVSHNYYAYGARTLTGLLGFEKRISSTRLSWYLDVGYADHRSKQDTYRDTAHGMGGEAGINIYWGRRTIAGLYIGTGLGAWKLKGGWKDDVGTPFVTMGRGTASVIDFNIHLGYKWLPAGLRGFFIDPLIALDLMDTNSEPFAFGPAAGSLKAELAIGKRW